MHQPIQPKRLSWWGEVGNSLIFQHKSPCRALPESKVCLKLKLIRSARQLKNFWYDHLNLFAAHIFFWNTDIVHTKTLIDTYIHSTSPRNWISCIYTKRFFASIYTKRLIKSQQTFLLSCMHRSIQPKSLSWWGEVDNSLIFQHSPSRGGSLRPRTWNRSEQQLFF